MSKWLVCVCLFVACDDAVTPAIEAAPLGTKPSRDLPDPLSAETAMRWEDDAVVFTLRTNNLRVAVFPAAR